MTRNSSTDTARETRKLQEVGGGTFTVSIPKAWAVEHGMEAGSEVHLYPHTDGSLVLRGCEHDGGRLDRVELDAADLSPTETTALVWAAYTVGYERIEVTADPLTDDQREAVRRSVRRLIGVEYGPEGEDTVVLRNLFDATAVSVQQSAVRMRSVALSMHRAATEHLLAADAVAAEADPIDQRAVDVTQSFGVLARHLNRSFESLAELDDLGIGRARLFDYYHIGEQLGQVADHAARLATLATRVEDGDLPPGVKQLADTTRTVIEEATSAVVEIDTEQATDALAQSEATADRIADREREATAPTAVRALDCLRRTNESGGRIARAALARTVRPRDDTDAL